MKARSGSRRGDHSLSLHLTLAAALLMVLVVSLALLWPSGSHQFDEPEGVVVRRQVPYPIVLLHGLGGDAKGWVDSGLKGFFEQKSLRFGGTVKALGEGPITIEGGSVGAPEGDFFHLEISDPFQGLAEWVREIEQGIRRVQAETGAYKVVLVGFSAGGVAARRYVVEHSEDHAVARLVTLASPHLGSEWAYALLVKDLLTEAQARGGLTGRVVAPLISALGAIEEMIGIPLDGGLVRDLLPEAHNDSLAALNHAPHPRNLEYACIRAAGAPAFHRWEELEADIARLRQGQIGASRLVPKLGTVLLAGAAFLSQRPSLQGDGAVLFSSQDLFEVAYFREHPEHAYEVIDEVATVEVGHFGAKGEHRAVVGAIASKVRFLDAGLLSGGGDQSLRAFVDFHDYFAGALEVTAESAVTGGQVPVTRPVLYQRGGEVFARVVIGPLDPAEVPAVDLIVHSLEYPEERVGVEDTSLLYGKRLILSSDSSVSPFAEGAFEPKRITVVAIRDIPRYASSGHRQWDLDGSPPDLRLIWFAGAKEKRRSRVYNNVNGSLGLDYSLEIGPGLADQRITLELWDADIPAPELMGRLVWNPGELRAGTSVEKMENGLAVEFEVHGTRGADVLWEAGTWSLRE